MSGNAVPPEIGVRADRRLTPLRFYDPRNIGISIGGRDFRVAADGTLIPREEARRG